MDIEKFFGMIQQMDYLLDEACLFLRDSASSCELCHFNAKKKCLMDVKNFLESLATMEWQPKVIDNDSECRVHIENIDRLAAEVCELENTALENKILKEHLTQEVLANLEMRIALEMNKALLQAKEEEDVCSED